MSVNTALIPLLGRGTKWRGLFIRSEFGWGRRIVIWQAIRNWVIDGWNEYTKQSWMTTYGPNNQVNPEVLLSEEYYCLVHCNFGWGGKCDGYYWYDLFDTTKRLDSDKIDTGAGDYAGSNGSADYKFAYNFKMVVYDK